MPSASAPIRSVRPESRNAAAHTADVAMAYPWLSARSRNALRRRSLMSIVFGGVFVATLIGLVLIPRQRTRIVHLPPPPTAKRPDTSAALALRANAADSMAHADSLLAAARQAVAVAATVPPPAVIDTIAPALKAERDSLTALLSALTQAMTRAAESPLPLAFRELGESRALANNAQVRAWLDSLAQVDKLRAPFGALGAGDPIYVSLTARVNELGRSIRDAAALRQSELKARLAPLLPRPVPPERLRPQIDTVSIFAAYAAARERYASAMRALVAMRAMNAKIDSLHAEAREVANIGAPPMAMLAASLVVALALSFGTVIAAELRHPRIAHTREAELIANTRVLAVIRPAEVVDRARRHADIAVLPLVDLTSESYHRLYLHLAATGAQVPVVTVTGDIPAVVATVAANLAAVSAYEARSTLIVDADPATACVASVLRVRATPGLMGLLSDTGHWVDAAVSTPIGRDRILDILPSGNGRIGTAPPEAIEHVRTDLTHMQSRYDLIVIAAPTSYAQLATNTIIPAHDVVVCARLGDTRLSDLRSALQSLRGAGRVIHGIVLWDGDIPRV